MAESRLIVALDYPGFEEMKDTVEKLGDSISHYKVGMELYYSAGPAAIRYLTEQGKQVFLDLKLHDIPNTVAGSSAALTRLGVFMFNVHASGGQAMMSAAVESSTEQAQQMGLKRPLLIAVTVLTSINQKEWTKLGHTAAIAEQVVHLAVLAKESGMDGVVASAQEAAAIRQACGPEFHIVTPGIRPVWAALNDQSRITTPADALKAGASFLVVGRPITAAGNPVEAASKIISEMRGLV